MQCRAFQVGVAAILMVAVTGCCNLCKRGEKAERPETAAQAEKVETNEAPAQQVSLSDVPEPARAVIEKVTPGGQIKKRCYVVPVENAGQRLYAIHVERDPQVGTELLCLVNIALQRAIQVIARI